MGWLYLSYLLGVVPGPCQFLNRANEFFETLLLGTSQSCQRLSKNMLQDMYV